MQCLLRIDASLRDTNNPKNSVDEFSRFFRFSDGKGINNTSGFRPKSKAGKATNIENCAFCILVTNFGEPEWPDSLNYESGIFTYFGDKRSPGDLHETIVGGNRFLRSIFSKLHTGDRESVPPLLVFEKYRGSDGMYMRFLGLAAPGAEGLSAFDDLVAVYRVQEKTRFQNYRAMFSILKSDVIDKEWLEDLVRGVLPSSSKHCPQAWLKWVDTGIYINLTCERKSFHDQKKTKSHIRHLKRRCLIVLWRYFQIGNSNLRQWKSFG
jgi:hypothetical protein